MHYKYCKLTVGCSCQGASIYLKLESCLCNLHQLIDSSGIAVRRLNGQDKCRQNVKQVYVYVWYTLWKTYRMEDGLWRKIEFLVHMSNIIFDELFSSHINVRTTKVSRSISRVQNREKSITGLISVPKTTFLLPTWDALISVFVMDFL